MKTKFNIAAFLGCAVIAASALYANPPENGQCGAANGVLSANKPNANLCLAGATGTVSGLGPWTWTCSGLNGGGDASCSANRNPRSPLPFSFPTENGVAVNQPVTSKPVQITGMTDLAALQAVPNVGYSFSANESSACDQSILAGTRAVALPIQLAFYNNYYLCVQHMSAATPGTCVTTYFEVTGVIGSFTSCTAGAGGASGATKARYRLYTPSDQYHLYTSDVNEYTVLAQYGWSQEGIKHTAWADESGVYAGLQVVPYYRLYNRYTGEHHWTADVNEYQMLPIIAKGVWFQESIDSYVIPPTANASQTAGLLALHRLYLRSTGRHLWTTDVNEKNVLVDSAGWEYEGISAYMLP